MASRWTVRLFTLFDIPVRIHLMAPALAVVLTVTTPDYTRREVFLALLLFFAVAAASTLFHELGHALAFRRHGLRAHGILLWPLGGLTEGDPARHPGPHVRVALAGVAMNLLLAVLAGGAMYVRDGALPGLPRLEYGTDVLLAVWNLNLALLLLNLLPGLPFDGGAALEGLLWSRFGRPRARLVVLGSGAVIGLGLVLGGIANENLLLAAVGGWALFEVARLYQELREQGMENEAFLGVYDFSEGNTSLEASAPPEDAARRRRAEAQEKAERAERNRAAAAEADRESARRRLDRLLDRIAAEGLGSLSADERVFLDEESRRLRAMKRGKSPTRP